MRPLSILFAIVFLLMPAVAAQPDAHQRLNLREFNTICVGTWIVLNGEVIWELQNELLRAFKEKADLLEVTPDDCGSSIPSNSRTLLVTAHFEGLTTSSGVVYNYWIDATTDLLFPRRYGEAINHHQVKGVHVYHHGGYGIVPVHAWQEQARDALEDEFDAFVLDFKRQTSVER